jgi:acyl-CoA hydrolase
MKFKKVSDSKVDQVPEFIFPSDLNAQNTVFGGKVLAMMDKIAGYVAYKHSGLVCRTLSVDSVRFLAPATQGEILIFQASVNRVWRSSMEIGVKVYSENVHINKLTHILSAYLTFVAIGDSDGKPMEIPYKITPETKDEERRYNQAEERRHHRLKKIVPVINHEITVHI